MVFLPSYAVDCYPEVSILSKPKLFKTSIDALRFALGIISMALWKVTGYGLDAYKSFLFDNIDIVF